MQQRANLERTMTQPTRFTLWHITKKAFVLLSLFDSTSVSDTSAEVRMMRFLTTPAVQWAACSCVFHVTVRVQ